MYEVYSNYGYTNELLICTSDSYEDAIERAETEAGYVDGRVDVIRFEEDGEAVIYYTIESEECY